MEGLLKLLTCFCPDSRLHNCCFCQLQDVRAATETLKSSHGPNGICTCFALVLAGWRCLRPEWHGDHLIVHHQWQQSWTGTCKPCLQIPIAPMGTLLTRLPPLSLAQLWLTLWSTTASKFCRGPQVFPSMGKLLTRLTRLSLAQLQQVCSAADLKFAQRPYGMPC